MASVRDEAARELWDWIVEHYRKSGDILGMGVGNANDPWAAIRIPSGEVGVLKLVRVAAIAGVADPHRAVWWLRSADWKNDYQRYGEPEGVLWQDIGNVSVQDDAIFLMEREPSE